MGSLRGNFKQKQNNQKSLLRSRNKGTTHEKNYSVIRNFRNDGRDAEHLVTAIYLAIAIFGLNQVIIRSKRQLYYDLMYELDSPSKKRETLENITGLNARQREKVRYLTLGENKLVIVEIFHIHKAIRGLLPILDDMLRNLSECEIARKLGRYIKNWKEGISSKKTTEDNKKHNKS